MNVRVAISKSPSRSWPRSPTLLRNASNSSNQPLKTKSIRWTPFKTSLLNMQDSLTTLWPRKWLELRKSWARWNSSWNIKSLTCKARSTRSVKKRKSGRWTLRICRPVKSWRSIRPSKCWIRTMSSCRKTQRTSSRSWLINRGAIPNKSWCKSEISRGTSKDLFPMSILKVTSRMGIVTKISLLIVRVAQ